MYAERRPSCCAVSSFVVLHVQLAAKVSKVQIGHLLQAKTAPIGVKPVGLRQRRTRLPPPQ
jgi:hypothetical protein